METLLHTERETLRRGDLDGRFAIALEQVEAAQAARTSPLEWHTTRVAEVLQLDVGATFIPSGEDAREGQAGMIFGGLALVFGLALGGVILEGDQDETWMYYLAPVLVAFGAYHVWSSRKRNAAARERHRRTGVYLFDDALLDVSTFGCRVFPVEHVHDFEFRQSNDSNVKKFILRYVSKDGGVGEANLMPRDLSPHISAWLKRARA